MSIEKELTSRMKDAMRSKDTAALDVLRMVKSEASLAKTAAGFDGETDDAFWTEVISRYVKKQKKAKVEFEKAGDAGKENANHIQFEIDYLQPFLPKLLTEEEVREIVRKVIADTGAKGQRMVGKVIGAVMKNHREEVDAAVVKAIAGQELGS